LSAPGADAGIVVVGGGLAGIRAVETIRAEGYNGPLTLVGAEAELPYNRPPLSKDVLAGKRAADTYLCLPARLDDLEVTAHLGRPARALDLTQRRVDLGDDSVPFDRLLLAPGVTARTLPVLDGRQGAFTLRTLDDARRLQAEFARAERVIVVGAGFIGSEVAASARALGHAVTIVEMDTAPLSRAFGAEIGAALTQLHVRNGVELVLGQTIEEVLGDEPLRMRLTDGRVLEADVVVVGVGAVPATSWLEGSGLTLDNGIVCNAALNAGVPGIYAAGDAVSWHNELFDRRMRVEHWTNAAEQGRHAALELVHGAGTPFRGANYVWSDQYDVRIQFAGTATDDVVVLDGSSDELTFLAGYRSGDRLVGILAVSTPKLFTQARRMIESGERWDAALAAF
jgi:NADPH-dependent 2,4-dienoyl-CoA reductase/sulfur reductase-like enzyme